MSGEGEIYKSYEGHDGAITKTGTRLASPFGRLAIELRLGLFRFEKLLGEQLGLGGGRVGCVLFHGFA